MIYEHKTIFSDRNDRESKWILHRHHKSNFWSFFLCLSQLIAYVHTFGTHILKSSCSNAFCSKMFRSTKQKRAERVRGRECYKVCVCVFAPLFQHALGKVRDLLDKRWESKNLSCKMGGGDKDLKPKNIKLIWCKNPRFSKDLDFLSNMIWSND